MSANVRFEDFELDPGAYRLWYNRAIVHLERIPFELLCLLVERRGQVVSREEILARVWGQGVFVDGEHSINTAVRKIRRALKDDADSPRFVATIPAKGYRFIAEVVASNGEVGANRKPADELVEVPPVPALEHEKRASLAYPSLAAVLISIFAISLLVQYLLWPAHSIAPPQEQPVYPPVPRIPSIAVLPFANVSNERQQEYFSDGITNQLINDLSRLPDLFVIARNSSFAYKGKITKEQEVGKELGVRYVLEGSVQRASDRLRIDVELVEAGTGREMWSKRYDRPLRDIFAVQDEIVGGVVATIGEIFRLRDMNLPHWMAWRPTDNVEAFDDFLRAVEALWRHGGTKRDNEAARQWTEKAIELDPQFAEAYAFAGWTYSNEALNQFSDDPQMDFERSNQMAQKALALDDSNADAHALLARNDWAQRRFDQAVADAQSAVAINPNYAQSYSILSEALNVSGRHEEALSAVQKAARLDPTHPSFYALWIGLAYNGMGRYQDAVSALKQCIEDYPNNIFAHLGLAIAYEELGQDGQARAEAAETMRINPQFALPSPEEGYFKDLAFNERVDKDMRRAGLK